MPAAARRACFANVPWAGRTLTHCRSRPLSCDFSLPVRAAKGWSFRDRRAVGGVRLMDHRPLGRQGLDLPRPVARKRTAAHASFGDLCHLHARCASHRPWHGRVPTPPWPMTPETSLDGLAALPQWSIRPSRQCARAEAGCRRRAGRTLLAQPARPPWVGPRSAALSSTTEGHSLQDQTRQWRGALASAGCNGTTWDIVSDVSEPRSRRTNKNA